MSSTANATVESVPFTQVVGGITVSCEQATVKPVSCARFPTVGAPTINWGDGQTSAGTASFGGSSGVLVNTVDLNGTHTYFEAGTYTVTSSAPVTTNGSTQQVSGGSITITVANAPLTEPAANPSSTAQTGVLFSGRVAQFTDTNPHGVPNDNTAALINWGDGQTSPGTITTISAPTAPGGLYTYAVAGSHRYATKGSYITSLTVTNGGASVQLGATTVAVSDPALTTTATSVAATQGAKFSGVVARFTDPDTFATPANFSATVNWGDGTDPTIATVTAMPGGGFEVSGAHIYTTAGAETITAKVSFLTDAPTSISTPAQIVAAPLGSPLPLLPTQSSPAVGGTKLAIHHLIAVADAARMAVSCAQKSSDPCHGTLTAVAQGAKDAQGTGGAHATKPGKARLIVADEAFSVAAGHTSAVVLRLNRQGRRLVRLHYRLPVTVTLTGTSSAHFPITYGYPRIIGAITYDATYGTTAARIDAINDVVFSGVPRGARLTMLCRRGACSPHAQAFHRDGQTVSLGSRVVARLSPHGTLDLAITRANAIGLVVEVTNPGAGPPPSRTLCLPPWSKRPVTCA